ncbi:Serine/threonine-protein kinase [Scheffersomyces spartinae]|uniref:Serine/threonine-protein kinase SCH9 n=1 Tax=Scheffersomyces spartinae TaxID=45513 RepID=A0A9P7VBS2_9ASCO|nr:Serine/threonine-protein kinase [Scheffersomyces spartinae]KAG7194997.1 Serine/threonine-protein kinase [Scheffersomyces spartinae]
MEDHQNHNIDGGQTASPHISNKFVPKGFAPHVAPTTAISSNSVAYGTNSIHADYDLHRQHFERQLHQQNINYQQQLSATPHQEQEQLAAQLPHHHQQQLLLQQQQQQEQEQQQQCAPQTSQQTAAAPFGYSVDQPLIITTDETGQNVHTQSEASQPKGKLKVKIVEGKDIQATQPYVVCTFESSEFVTTAPGSFGGKSLLNHGYGHHDSAHGAQGRAGVPMKNKPRPMYQRQTLTQQLTMMDSTNPVWNYDALFDVVGSKSELDVSVYDAARDDAFLGHVRIFPTNKKVSEEWFELKARILGERVTGAIKISWAFSYDNSKKQIGPDDFEMLRLLGKGTFGQVFQVKKGDTGRIYAMKVLSKKVIVKKKEIAHTIGERNILVRTSAAGSSFIVGLKFSFQTPTDLYLVTDYMSGGELFWHLQKEGRFTEDRAKFYIAELILALEHLHDNDIVYRDLKPENILLDANGHIALCDFGLSKANLNNDGTTNTFCGTTEYLAPEVLLDESGYTKMVDFWSLGVLIFEMCCGWSPFYANNTQQMYKNIAFGKVRFPKEVLSTEGRSFVKGLLNRNPKHRLGAINDARELRAHPFFNDIDWTLLRSKSVPPPFKPHLTSETDTSNFDPEFTSESTSVIRKQLELASTPLSPGIQANFKGFTYVDDSTIEDHMGKSARYNKFMGPGSFIPGNPNLPPDEDVIEDQIDEEDEMEIEDQHMDDEEFVNGRFEV